MPTKNFSGSLINYGTALPDPSTTPDGALFFKFGGVDEGLYLFSFISDTDLGSFGTQAGQAWLPVTGASSSIDADTFGGQPPSYYQVSSAILDGIINLGSDTGVLVKTGASTFDGKAIEAANLTPSGSTRIFVSNGTGTAAGNIQLDVNQANLSLNSIGGTLGVSKGGTGLTTAVDGGILYGATTSTMAFTTSGTSGHLLQSGGTGAPSWVNPASLTVSTANYANSAGTAGSAGTAAALSPGATIDIVGPAANPGYFQADAVTFTGASNVSIAVTSINSNLLTAAIPLDLVLWNRIDNLDTGSRTFTNSPASGFTTIARPSLFYNFGNTGALSMTPSQFQTSSLSGFDGYFTSDIGQYQVGLTVMGTAGSGARAVQIAANWNFEETAPSDALRYRVNDDTGTVASWGPWRTIVDEGSSKWGDYVARAGDTMTGTLRTTALAVGNPSMPSTGSASFQGNVVAARVGVTSSGDFNNPDFYWVNDDASNLGFYRSADDTLTLAASTGDFVHFNGTGTTLASRYVEILATTAATSRTTGALRVDGGVGIQGDLYCSDISAAGSIVATGNVTAFSDRRIKENIQPIQGALDKLMKIDGVTYNRIGQTRREVGVIAQNVLEVLPEVVFEHEDKLSVAYGNMVALLIQAIKEQQEQINELKAQLNK